MCSETPTLSSTSSFSSAWSCPQGIAQEMFLSPSGKVCRRNPDPGLPITSRQRGQGWSPPASTGRDLWEGALGTELQWGCRIALSLCQTGEWATPELSICPFSSLAYSKTSHLNSRPFRHPQLPLKAAELLFKKMLLMEEDICWIHGSCHATSPGNSLPPQPHCHTEYTQVSYNKICCDCHHPTQHDTTRWHTHKILCIFRSSCTKKFSQGREKEQYAKRRYWPKGLCSLLLF